MSQPSSPRYSTRVDPSFPEPTPHAAAHVAAARPHAGPTKQSVQTSRHAALSSELAQLSGAQQAEALQAALAARAAMLSGQAGDALPEPAAMPAPSPGVEAQVEHMPEKPRPSLRDRMQVFDGLEPPAMPLTSGRAAERNVPPTAPPISTLVRDRDGTERPSSATEPVHVTSEAPAAPDPSHHVSSQPRPEDERHVPISDATMLGALTTGLMPNAAETSGGRGAAEMSEVSAPELLQRETRQQPIVRRPEPVTFEQLAADERNAKRRIDPDTHEADMAMRLSTAATDRDLSTPARSPAMMIGGVLLAVAVVGFIGLSALEPVAPVAGKRGTQDQLAIAPTFDARIDRLSQAWDDGLAPRLRTGDVAGLGFSLSADVDALDRPETNASDAAIGGGATVITRTATGGSTQLTTELASNSNPVGAAELSSDEVSFELEVPEPVAVAKGGKVGARPLLTSTPSSVPLEPADVTRLRAKVDSLLANNDVAAAREVLGYLALAGSLEASEQLARSYDPAHVRGLGDLGLRADAARAIQWYRHAAELGSVTAMERVASLEALSGTLR